mgnify:CR=1 FL=1
MGLFDNFKKTDVRSLENPNAPVSADDFLHIMGGAISHLLLVLRSMSITPLAPLQCGLRAPLVVRKLANLRSLRTPAAPGSLPGAMRGVVFEACRPGPGPR